MALLLFQLSIVFTVGLFFINGPLSANAFIINKEGPGPRLSFIAEPPEFAVVSRKSPLFLPCSVNFTEENPYEDEEDYFQDDDDEYENEDDDDVDAEETLPLHLPETNRKDSTHFNDLKSDDIEESRIGEHKDGNTDDEDDGGEDDEGFTGFRMKRHIKKKHKNSLATQYTWYRNGTILNVTNTTFRVFKNGTLKIPYSDAAPGTYRCLANETLRNAGAIISRECVVTQTEFSRSNSTSNVTDAEVGHPIVLNCPIFSIPPANISWSFNNASLPLKNSGTDKQNRYFQLQNGSLLITKVKGVDSGRFKCMAENIYLAKPRRGYIFAVNVIPSDTARKRSGLLPPLQDQIQRIKSGTTLKLFCASYSESIEWTFTPRLATIPIKLINISNELKYSNASRQRHDGVYNCSTSTDYQIYDITVISPPVFEQTFNSITSTMAASVSLACNATGYPLPTIDWYHNGQKLNYSHPIHYDNPLLRLHSLEPEDEGIYQCFAKNEAGQIQLSGYLTLRNSLRNKQKLSKRLQKVQCFPINHSTLYVRFETTDHLHMVNYYLATENPYTWIAPTPLVVHTNNSIIISGNLQPLKMYTLYMRGLMKLDSHISMDGKNDKTSLLIARMSKGVKCATQGLEIYSTSFPTGIFIWWPRTDKVAIKYFTVQFWHNDTANPTVFSDQIIGTTYELDEYQTWQEIETNLIKIPAVTRINNSPDYLTRIRRSLDIGTNSRQIFDSLDGTSVNSGGEKINSKTSESSSLSPSSASSSSSASASASTVSSGKINSGNITITEVRISGNVTGILIPNSNRIVVRVLGTTDENELYDQNIRFVEWKTIENSPNGVSKLRVTNVNSRRVTLSWNSFGSSDKYVCLQLCYKNVNHDFIIRGEKNAECKTINSNRSSMEIASLSAFTTYKMYLRNCNSSEPVTEVIDVQTKHDVPGPVTRQRLSKENGITLHWGPPINTNGVLLYYSIEWSRDNKVMAANVSINENSFKFPNVTSSDKFNITIRAVGSAGIGIPIYLTLLKQSESDIFERNEHYDADPTLGIAIGVLLSIFLIIICMLIIIKHRNCAKKRPNVSHNRSLPPPPTIPPCSTDIHEMQTLITRPELPTLIPNGKVKHTGADYNSDGGINRDNERQRIMLTSSPKPPPSGMVKTIMEDSFRFKDMSDDSNDNMPSLPSIEPIINAEHSLRVIIPSKSNSNSSSPLNKNIQSLHPNGNSAIYLNGSLKNSSPLPLTQIQQHSVSPPPHIKSNGNLRITENPQYLTDPNLNNTTTSSIFDNSQQKLLDTTIDSSSILSNNSHIRDQVQSDIEREEFLEVDESQLELINSKPLHSTWNFRRPIVGPNG